MAKQKGMQNVSGKLGDKVGAKSKSGYYLRDAPKNKKNRTTSPAFDAQGESSSVAAPLASRINTAVKQYGRHFISSDFYHSLLKKFGKEKNKALTVLLNSIGDADLNPKHKFLTLSPLPDFEFTKTKTQYIIETEVKYPAYSTKNANCFFLEFILLVWSEGTDNIRQGAGHGLDPHG